MYIVETNQNKIKKKSESKITTDLSWNLFAGAGEKFLGFKFADRDLQDDGTWAIVKKSKWDVDEKMWVANYDHPEYWTVPENRNVWQHSVLLKHLQGKHRGIVATSDSGVSDVPFIAADIDRHHNENAEKHIERVIRVGRQCILMFPHLRWLVEVNPNNGSSKIYGFGRKAIGICKARIMAEKLHSVVVQITGQNTEVFPHNMPQILLPFRRDKITIIAGGELNKVDRYKIINRKRVPYITYSMCEFHEWWRGSQQYDEKALIETLEKACACQVMSPIGDIAITKSLSLAQQMMEQAYREAMGFTNSDDVDVQGFALKSSEPPTGSANRISKPNGRLPKNSSQILDSIRKNPNAFDRKREFSLWLSRRLRRVPTVDEVLDAYKEHKMFNGLWEDKELKRRADFRAILPYVAKSFDASMCGHDKSQRPELDQKINLWKGRATSTFVWQTKFTTIINQKRKVDEYGTVTYSNGKKRKVCGKKLPLVMAIVEQVRSDKSDGGIPRDSIQGWWEDLADEGKLPKWSIDTWQAYRQILVQIGWICVNHDYSHRQHKAKTCKITYGNEPLVGTIYTYPSNTYSNTTTSIIVVTHSSQENLASDNDLIPRPPPMAQPPPIRRFLPSFEEQISWN
ncbi:MAG TPA: hypothetical protein DIW81_00705 [Planctomycetaceae bacterium]|nr:hypothetical protein [Rubinisphaera sp.]MBV12397.1 hypothetical protein [Rubinisphaera sp.]HCS50104.1 hypothetical protein [Planctomycetaceae bacterium]